MALLCYNKTASPVTLAAGNPARSIPASSSPPNRGVPVNVTTELSGLSGANYTAIQAQVTAGDIEFEWTSDPEFAVGSLVVGTPNPIFGLVGDIAAVGNAAAAGASGRAADAAHVHTLGGSVGGSLSGTLPNPSIANDAVSYAQLADIVHGPAQSISSAGAIDVVTRTTNLESVGAAQAMTLADGSVTGQRKSIIMSVGGGGNTAVLTPSNFGDGSTMTFNNKFDSVELEWNGATWRLVSYSGAIVVA